MDKTGGMVCFTCKFYNHILVHTCKKEHDIYFVGGCKDCGEAKPSSWVWRNIPCEDYEYDTNIKGFWDH